MTYSYDGRRERDRERKTERERESDPLSSSEDRQSHRYTFLLRATPSSHSRTAQSTPRSGVFRSFFMSWPGMYIKVRRGTYLRAVSTFTTELYDRLCVLFERKVHATILGQTSRSSRRHNVPSNCMRPRLLPVMASLLIRCIVAKYHSLLSKTIRTWQCANIAKENATKTNGVVRLSRPCSVFCRAFIWK